jgi:hypothetical protein
MRGLFVQALLSTAMAGLLLLHAAAGVAWHHESGCAEGGAEACCSCGHESAPAPAAPCQCHWECETCCNYLPAPKVHVDRAADVAFTPAADAAIGFLHTSLSDSFSGFALATEAAAPPVRLHLLNQSLLV